MAKRTQTTRGGSGKSKATTNRKRKHSDQSVVPSENEADHSKTSSKRPPRSTTARKGLPAPNTAALPSDDADVNMDDDPNQGALTPAGHTDDLPPEINHTVPTSETAIDEPTNTALLSSAYLPADSRFTRNYSPDWFVDENAYNVFIEPETISSGTDFDIAMAEAKKNVQHHPLGVRCLTPGKLRESEGLMMSYMGFKNAVNFRTWIAKECTCNKLSIFYAT
jgi:hypothetical protein